MKYKIKIITKAWHEKIYIEDYLDDAVEKAKLEALEKNGGKIVSVHVDELED